MAKPTVYKLKNIARIEDIPEGILNTPVGNLLKHHNLNEDSKEYKKAELLIITCMDFRINLRLPDRFAYIVRTAGARITNLEFKISFASSIAGIKHIALIGHTDCAMINLFVKKEKFTQGLVTNALWQEDNAENHFNLFAPYFNIEDEKKFVLSESLRLKKLYPGLNFYPLIYNIEDSLLYLLH